MMGDELTRQQAERDDFLRKLAQDPSEALRHWKRLKPGEPTKVIISMAMTYGPAFAQHFKQEADRNKRPDTSYTVTNAPGVTPESLTKQGFKFSKWLAPPDQPGGWPAMSVWVHPSGKEVWLIQGPAKATPPASLAPKQAPPIHPDIESVQFYVKEYAERRADLIREGRDLEARRSALGKQEYDRLRKEWFDELYDWQDELDDTMGEILTERTDDLMRDELEKKNAEINRLKAQAISWPTEALGPDPRPSLLWDPDAKQPPW
jgi:hypothetical protein